MVNLSFRIHSPSPSTICYTISNAPRRSSSLSKSLHVLGLASRLVFALSCIAVSLVQARASWTRRNDEWPLETFLRDTLSHVVGEKFTSRGDQWWLLFVLALGLAWLLSRRDYTGMFFILSIPSFVSKCVHSTRAIDFIA